MKKLVLGAILVLLVTIGFGIYYLLSNIDGLVKQGIETYGSQATGTRVQVASVKIGLRDGSGAIRGLQIGNPPGYAAPEAVSLGEVSTKLALNEMSRELVVIDEVRIIAPEVFFELNQTGRSNLDDLRKKLASPAKKTPSSEKPSASSADSVKAPDLLVRHLLFDDGRIHARIVALNKDYELKLPRIEMKNIGGKDGMTPQRIGAQILQRLTEVALQELQKQGLDRYRKQLEGEANKRISAETRKIEKKLDEKIGSGASEALKGLLKQQ